MSYCIEDGAGCVEFQNKGALELRGGRVLHQFVQARVVDYNPNDPNLPVNSPRAHCATTKEVLHAGKGISNQEMENRFERFP